MRCCCAGEAGSSRLPSMLDSSSAESYGDVVLYVSAAPFALGKTVVISWTIFHRRRWGSLFRRSDNKVVLCTSRQMDSLGSRGRELKS